jgi:hypothetical protein
VPRKLNSKAHKHLLNQDWLRQKHVNELYSQVEISKMLGCTPSSVAKALRQFDIKSPSQQSLREATLQRKYGVKNIGTVTRDQALQTMIERFGGHYLSYDGRRKERDQKMLEKYGTTNVGGLPKFVEKARQTNQERYGRDHQKQSHIPRKVLHLLKDREWLYQQHYIERKTLSEIATDLGFGEDMTTVMRHFHKHGFKTQHYQFSFEEHQVLNYIKSLYNKPIFTNDRDIISPLELDIVLPDIKLAIEYCGLYHHTEQAGKGRYYHKTKWEKCGTQGYRLLTIFSDEWNERQDLVKRIIKRALCCDDSESIPARKCTIEEISTYGTIQQFLEDNHIQGASKGTINYGLKNRCGEVIAVIVFEFYQKTDTWYINRYATSCKVPGGFSRLLTHFKRNHKWSEIVTFADLRWSNGDLYEKADFTFDKILKPDYYWIYNGKRYHKFNYRRKYLPQRLNVFDPRKSEVQNCLDNGLQRIWNCGLKRYVLRSVSNELS